MSLQLISTTLEEKYCKKWNVHEKDFLMLVNEFGERVNDSIYRIGGMNNPTLKEDYFMLLKYEEAFYSKDVLNMSGSKDPKHLQGIWVIINNKGEEKLTFPPYKYPYLVKNSCIYSIESTYYNVETNELYTYSHSALQSDGFLFLENLYDKDKSKRGVLKIDKKTGEYELFPFTR